MQMTGQDDIDATASQRLELRVASGIERMMRHENPDVLRPELLHVSADAFDIARMDTRVLDRRRTSGVEPDDDLDGVVLLERLGDEAAPEGGQAGDEHAPSHGGRCSGRLPHHR